MITRILHLSDLHVGANDGPRDDLESEVGALVASLQPQLVVATGDLTHRNRRDQHGRAATFLRSLGRPLLVLPGNHDLPALPPRRLTAPYAAFLAEWPETEPVFRSEDIVACGLCSVRPRKYQRGGVSASQLERVAAVFAESPPDALRVVALHHHLAGAPWRTGKRSIPRRAAVLAALGEAGARLVLSGHTHQGLVVECREFSVAQRSLVLAVSPGLGRPRPGRHAEACGLHLIEVESNALRLRTFAWHATKLVPVAERTFRDPAPPRKGAAAQGTGTDLPKEEP